jgi:hypothetical protein
VADTPVAVPYPAVRTVVERLLHDPAPVLRKRNKVGRQTAGCPTSPKPTLSCRC